MSKLLSSTTESRLVCVEFPTAKEPGTGGPPWALSPEVYLAHLQRPGVELPYDDKFHLQNDKLDEPTKDALQRIAHFKPKRTHEIGKGTDWVSVWRR
jgi:hypothetical protein